MGRPKKIAEAQFSSAGDDFHVRWTMKRCVDLLNFNPNGLKLITIENTELNFAKKVDPEGKSLLGVDLVEYFGGENFNLASSIEVIQLKYSTRRADKNYTFSSLYQGKKPRSYDGSIIHRFGQLFDKFINEYERVEIINKLKIKLISNRKFSESNNLVIKQIQEHLLRNKSKKTFNSLIKELPLKGAKLKAINNLKNASGLNSSEFVDLIRVIDFDECGVNSRSQQKLKIVNALCQLGSQNASNQFNNIFQLVWNKMMPESDESNFITKEDILHEFGFDSIESLYPIKQKFESLPSVVKREQIEDIAIQIVNNNISRPICIHGGAGIGKSTLINAIPKYLPKHYECILFDCYGAGEYQNPSDKRHTHRAALLHLSNVIAKQVGSSFLLNKNLFPEEYIREFKRRIEYAVEILKTRNKNSKLIILLDAVDNSITASEKDKLNSFVKDLLQEELPIGCELILSFRTYRMDSLELKRDKFIDIPINSFSLKETNCFLSLKYQGFDDGVAEEFHIRTGGIPRVQAYSLQPTIEETLRLLKPKQVTTVQGLIETNIEIVEGKLDKENSLKLDVVERKIGEVKIVNNFLKYLITLPRPVPIEIIKECTGLSKSIIEDISVDIWGGLIFNDEHFSFNDEDFENYIRQNYSPNLDDFNKIANVLLTRAASIEYASLNLGTFLFQSQQTDFLKEIVLKKKYLEVHTDLVKRKEVYIDRTRLAMKVSQNTNDKVSFVKLLMIAAEQAKTDSSLTRLLVQNVELAIAYSDSNTLNRLLLESENSWYGAVHYQLAAINSRTPDLIEKAKTHLKSASSWMAWRSRQKEDDYNNEYEISNEDIALGAEAYFRIFGIQKAFEWLNGWTPKHIIIDVTEIIAKQIFQHLDYDEVIREIEKVDLRLDIKIILLNVGLEFFPSKPIFDIDQILQPLDKLGARKIQFTKSFSRNVIEAIENILRFEPNKEKIFNALSVLKTNPFRRPPHIGDNRFHFDNKSKYEMDVFLRTESVAAGLKGKSIEIQDYYPKDFIEIDKIEDYKQKKSIKRSKDEFDRFFKHAIPIYQFRANQFLNRFKKGSNTEIDFKAICKEIGNDFDFRYYDGPWAKFKLNFLAGLNTDLAVGYGYTEWVDRIMASFIHDKLNYISLRFEVLSKIIHSEIFSKKSLVLLNEIDKHIKESNLPASESVEFYINCSLLARKINKTSGKYFFNEAVKAVSDIDIEARDQIRCFNNLSKIGLPNPNPKLAHEFSRFVEYSSIKLSGYDNFPLNEGVVAIANLDPASAFTITARWHHRYVLNITEYIGAIIKSISNKEYLKCDVAGSLLPLNIYMWDEYVEICKILIEQHNTTGDSEKKSGFVRHLINDVKLSNARGVSHRIFNLIKDNKFLERKLVLDLKNCVDFIDCLEGYSTEKSSKKNTLKVDDNEKEELKYYDINSTDFSSTISIEEQLKIIKTKSDNHFDRPFIDDFFKEMKENCNPKDFISHLNALIDVNPEFITFYSIKNALEERFLDWDYIPEIREWKKNRFKYFLQIWFSHFRWESFISTYEIKDIANLFSIDKAQLSVVISEILPENINTMSAESIYQTVELIQHNLSKVENEAILLWTVEKWNQNLDNNFGDGEWNHDLVPSKRPLEVVSGFLRFLLGDPDKKNRWRAIHSLRRLVHQGNLNILTTLLNDQNKMDCNPFQTKEYPFYWISSKLYLWVLIEKLSKEIPLKLLSFKNHFYIELGNKDLPHALIMFFIKQSCLNLYNYDSTIFTKEEYKIISNTLVSQLPRTKKNAPRKSRKKISHDEKEWNFDFDHLDTLPYWYDNLARPFNLSSTDVADIADRYISTKWGFAGHARKDDHVQVQGNNSWAMTSNRKGEIPQIENLKKYYEYHGMYCAASELLISQNLIEQEYSSGWGTWDYWLESDAYSWKDFWISDLTDPLPYDKKFWKSEYSKYNKDWKINIAEHKYDEVIGLLDASSNKFLTLRGGYTRHFGDNYESISIRSGLVSKRTSKALLRAMQFSKHNGDYHIPLEGSESEEIESEGIEEDFQLVGWVKEIYTEYQGLDEYDPFGKKSCKNYLSMGDIISKNFDLNVSENLKETTYKGKLISKSMSWDFNTENRSYDKPESDGSLFQTESKFLLSILKKLNKDLIVECDISRQLSESDYDFERDRSKLKNTAKLYLIHANGKVETIGRGSYKIGK